MTDAEIDRFLCPSRMEGSIARSTGDRWRKMPDGTRTCSFCGSLHETDFIAICEAYANGEPGFKIDPSTKPYKRYANRPGSNAGMGGIKFYTWHIDAADPAYPARAAVHDRAMAKFRETIAANYPAQAPGS